MGAVALIGGTAPGRLDDMKPAAGYDPDTPWGPCSHPVQAGRLEGVDIYYIARHGDPRRIPPHRINYRANIWALKELGVDRVIALSAVGGIHESMRPGRLVIPDQIIDYTWGRGHTFCDEAGDDAPLHIDFSEPYDSGLRRELIDAAAAAGIECAPRATCGVTQGPRLESPAEIRRMARDGCDLVGMTAMPEAALAAELGLRYAAVCLVINPAAGLAEAPIHLEELGAVIERGTPDLMALVGRWLRST